MRRRTLLATAGIGLSAGCSGFLPDSEGTPTDETTDAPAPTPTDGSAPTPPTDPTVTSDTGTTDEPTATPHPRADEVIADARAHLAAAHETYVAFAGEDATSILDVTAAVDVSIGGVSNEVSAARSDLADAPGRANEPQQRTIEALGNVGTLLERGIRCQSELQNAEESLSYVLDRVYAEQLTRVPNRIDQLRSEQDLAREHFDVVAGETAAADVDAFEPITTATYEDKISQFEAELTAFEALPDPLLATWRGLRAFIDASNQYLGESYVDAGQRYPTAVTELQAAADGLAAIDRPDSLASRLEALTSVTSALAAASVDLQAAAEAGQEGRRDDREAAFAAAESHLRSSSVAVERLDTVQELLE
jgi:hypothetical protein